MKPAAVKTNGLKSPNIKMTMGSRPVKMPVSQGKAALANMVSVTRGQPESDGKKAVNIIPAKVPPVSVHSAPNTAAVSKPAVQQATTIARPVMHSLPQQPDRPSAVAAPKPQNKTTVPLTLRDRSLEDLLTLPAPVVSAHIHRSVVQTTAMPALALQTPSASPPIIVSSPIKASHEKENDFMPAATTAAPSVDRKPEPVATFSIGDSLPSSSTKQQPTPMPVVKPPPPGATHLSSGVGVMLSHGGSAVRSDSPAISSGPVSAGNDTKKMNDVNKTPNAKPQEQKKANDVKLKNTSSWACLASLNSSSSSSKKQVSTQSFELFRKQALEREERQEEYRKVMKEKEERERIRQETERKREREEEDALEMARHAQAVSDMQQQKDADVLKAQREKERRKEQERCRRQAMSNQIDMNEQSALMAQFEDNL